MERASDAPAAAAGHEHQEASGRWMMLGLFVPLAVVVDQITKQLADAHLAGRGPLVLLEGLFMLTYSRNPGAFFSMGADMEPGIRRVFFVVATLAAVALIVHLYRRAAREQRALRWALLFLLAGAFGNLVDRVLYGEVIDFMRLHYQDVFYWATFNVADVYICVGLALLVVDLFRSSRRPAGTAAEPS